MSIEFIMACKVASMLLVGLIGMLWWTTVTFICVMLLRCESPRGKTCPETQSDNASSVLLWLITTCIWSVLVVVYGVWWGFQMQNLVAGNMTSGIFAPEVLLVVGGMLNGITTPIIASVVWIKRWRRQQNRQDGL